MLKRFRRLRISLAAKCQLLFGAAVVLIIAAALAVPWQRIGQLTEELNQRAAGALVENTLAQHTASRKSGREDPTTPLAESSADTPTTDTPTTQPDDFAAGSLPRLIRISPDRTVSSLTPFERR